MSSFLEKVRKRGAEMLPIQTAQILGHGCGRACVGTEMVTETPAISLALV